MGRWRWLVAIVILASPATAAAQRLTTADCLDCHKEPTLTEEVGGRTISVFVDPRIFRASAHGLLDCTDCHADVNDYPHQPPPQRVACAACHPDVQQSYDQGLHAQARRRGDTRAATCLDCHGQAHGIRPTDDPQSPVYRTHIPRTCGRCHSQKFVMEPAGLSTQPFFSYQESVHGRAVAAGSMKAAVCTDCHRSHDVRPPSDPQSTIFKFNVPRTCGQCHEKIATEFMESIHGQAIRRGNWRAPVCTDCHGIHSIKSHIDPNSPVAAQRLARTACGQCHEGVRLSQEFGVPGRRVSTYYNSYHGLATELGSRVAANCASCHGVHNILPSSDPRSTINKNNLVNTCGKCHPGASEKFVSGRIHANTPISEDIGSIVSFWVRKIYLWLIVLIIGSMALHNGLLWYKKAVAHRDAQERPIIRMTRQQRIQHVILLTSFFTLVITGFALKYPDSWLAWLLGESEAIRRVVHRAAGTVLLLLGIYHLGYVISTREGRESWRALRPVKRDFSDLIDTLSYYMGRRSVRPLLGAFSYVEKIEYWALIWGTLVMGITGLMAWFEVEVTHFLPRWTVEVALTIHFYEAILATLAIFVWHFYHVIFDPHVYPMNWSWLDGRVSAEHYRREHPLAYQEWVRRRASSGHGGERRLGSPSTSAEESP